MNTRNRKWVLGPAYSTYHGRVHIPNITVNPDVFLNKNVLVNTVCGGHVVVDESDMMHKKV